MEDFLALMPVRSKVEKPVVHITQSASRRYFDGHGASEYRTGVSGEDGLRQPAVSRFQARGHRPPPSAYCDGQGGRYGRSIDTRNNFYRSKQITRELERKYGLHDAERKNRRLDTPLHKVDASAGDVKKQAGNIVKAISGQYRFQTMGEYRALLSLYNMTVEEAHGNVRGREYHGLVDPSRTTRATRSAIRSSPRCSGSLWATKPCRRSLPVPSRRLRTGNLPT